MAVIWNLMSPAAEVNLLEQKDKEMFNNLHGFQYESFISV